MRMFVLTAALSLGFLAPAASDGQGPHSTHDTAAPFVCGVVQDEDSLRAALDRQFDPDRAHAGEAARAGCDGTCVIDVGFSYHPEAIDGTGGDCLGDPNSICERRAANVDELRRYLVGSLVIVNGIFQGSGVDVEFRLERLVPAGSDRSPWADLWYEINPLAGGGTKFSGVAALPIRNSDGSPRWVRERDGIVTFVHSVYREHRGHAFPAFFHWPGALAHEFGHSLGLDHGADDPFSPGVSRWPGGNGYRGRYKNRVFGTEEAYGTIMATWVGTKFPRFSDSDESLYGRPIGGSQANAVEVLRRNVPHLAVRAPSRATADYGCMPFDCIDRAGRFSIRFFHFGDSGKRLAGRLPAPVGPNAALYYFFDPANPEVLIKVLDGCGLNGHWWVFASAATDLPYGFWLEDLATGRRVRYEHSGGLVTGSNGFSGVGVINDVQAFRCEP